MIKKLILTIVLFYTIVTVKAQQIDTITGPTGSQRFGNTITVLTNGNYVITDPLFNDGSVTSVGAVYLYNGTNHSLISTLKGSNANDRIGNGGIISLSNGNYVVRSPNWNGSRGAATWCNGSTGISGTVSSSNSLVGSNAGDNVGSSGITAVSNGNYVVRSGTWNGTRGAATWGNGSTGVKGTVSSNNSLVGSNAGDYVGSTSNSGITVLSNGNYVVRSPNWNGNRGAATWGNGSTGITGTVSSSNSLVGSNTNDNAGAGVTALSNGNYVVNSSNWNGGLGATTWGNGSTGITGTVSSSNSLVGSNANDNVGAGIAALSNGNYVVRSPNWDGNRGAATWGNGSTGITGTVSSSNSLVGSNVGDNVGDFDIIALSNGNYVVNSPNWNGYRGAATWGNGSTGITGTVSSSNSLVGSNVNDNVSSSRTTALSNGNYVVNSPGWNGGLGSATWGNGSTGITGTVSSSNSLVGSNANEYVGRGGITALSNGNYVVRTPDWNGTRGAATWGNGSTGVSGTVSSSNSLVGSNVNDYVGGLSGSGIAALSNGNYVVVSQNWNGNRGAVTWGNGSKGIFGTVDSINSLVGSNASDFVGSKGVTTLSNGNYVVNSSNWNGLRGAATWGNGNTGISGTVDSGNSLVGGNANDNVGSSGITALSKGNYVVRSENWNGNRGAVSVSCKANPIAGTVSAFNSLLGASTSVRLGQFVEVHNSVYNYVLISSRNENKVYVSICPGPVIKVKGNGVAIINGDITPSLADSTDMGRTTSNLVRRFRIINSGTDTLKITNIISSGTDASDFVVSHIPGEISAGDSSLFTVTFSPSDLGIKIASVKIMSNDVIRDTFQFALRAERLPNAKINVKGNGVGIVNGNITPGLADSTDMGTTTSNLVRRYSILNTGTDTLKITNIISSGPDATDFVVSYIPGEITGGDSSLFTVTFSPSALGIKNASIRIFSNDVINDTFQFALRAERLPNAKINVKGNGVGIVNGNITPSLSDSTDMGATNSNVVRRFRIVNSGTDTLKITNIISSGTDASDFVVSNIPGEISAGDSSMFTVTFSPFALGVKNASIRIFSNDIINDTFQFAVRAERLTNANINVKGNGVDIVNADITPNLLDSTDMGATTSNLVRRFRILNSGTDTLKISNIVSSGTHASNFVVSNIPSEISAGDSSMFTVTFSPFAVGIKNASIKIFSNDVINDTFQFAVRGERLLNTEINVKGNGVGIVNGDITTSLLDSTDMGATSSNLVRRFRIVNSGTDTLIISNIINSGIDASNFVVSNIPNKISAGDSSLFTVTFSSSTVGIKNASIKIFSNDVINDTFQFAVRAEKLTNTKITNLDISENISVYPNPFSSLLNIDIESLIDGETAEITIFDALGKMVFKQDITSNAVIDINYLSNGFYSLSVQTISNTYRIKLLKN